MGDTNKLNEQIAELTAKNGDLATQLQNALEGKVDDVKEFMSKLSIQDEVAAKIKELTAENETLNNLVKTFEEKLGGLPGMASGALAAAAGAVGVDSVAAAAAGAASNAKDAADDAAASASAAAADGQDQAAKAAEEAQEKADEAAAEAISAATSLTKGFGW